MRLDIFCTVIDNYGDIGIAWRLARQLVAEYGIDVRLWVDDLASFKRIRPEINSALARQSLHGVEVRHWRDPLPVDALPADIVIEALACNLPEAYVEAMAARAPRPVWINLEYLSAEDWVAGCHGLPSPHPRLPLVKYFFFPGWQAGTGGVLREQCLEREIREFRSSPEAMRAFWQRLGLPASVTVGAASAATGRPRNAMLPSKDKPTDSSPRRRPGSSPSIQLDSGLRRNDEIALNPCVAGSPPTGGSPRQEIRVSLFAYENAAISELLALWSRHPEPVRCLVPEGRPLAQVAAFFDVGAARPGDRFEHGNLTVDILPMLDQDTYDRLLWSCDLNFVRGEDSFVRACWAGQPLVWQAYRQEEDAHGPKIDAFLKLYCQELPKETADALQAMWRAWNRESGAAEAWPAFWQRRHELIVHHRAWMERVGHIGDLADNLMHFCQEKL